MIGYFYCLPFFVGNGVVIHVPQFFEELEALEAKGSPLLHVHTFC